MNTETTPAPKEVPQPASGYGHRWFTVVFRGLTKDEGRELIAHPKGVIFAYSNAIAERDDARAVLAASGAPQEAPGDAPSDKLDELQREAARYRWLRENFMCATPTVQVSWTLRLGSKPLAETTEQEIDVAIDAAMKGPQ